jgi:hypothetical protein
MRNAGCDGKRADADESETDSNGARIGLPHTCVDPSLTERGDIPTIDPVRTTREVLPLIRAH